MTVRSRVIAPALMPLLRYRDLAGAIEWLGEAFGFERGSAITADNGTILYAQLILGNAMVLVEPAQDGTTSPPSAQSGGKSQSCYIVVADADAHYARARAAGAEIVLELDDFGQGGRGYSCRDAEGHVWSFGTYDPWHGAMPAPAESEPKLELQSELNPPPATAKRTSARWAILSGLCATILTSAVAAAWIGSAEPERATSAETTLANATVVAPDELARERAAREAAERTAQDAETRAEEQINAQEKSAREAARAAEEAASILVTEQEARAAAEKAAGEARAEFIRERGAKEAAQRAAADLEKELARRTAEAKAAAAHAAKPASKEGPTDRAAHENEASELKEKLAQEQAAREAAERARSEAQQALDRERAAAEAAGRTAADLKQQLAKEQTAKVAAERASQDAREQISRERASKDQAWKSVTQLRKQLARAQASANADYVMPADPPVASSGSGGTQKGDPQYNGPMSPF